MLSLTSAKSAALVGVAISVTTVPVAADAALALSYGAWHEAFTSTWQLALNLAGIVVAGCLTPFAQRTLWARTGRDRRSRRGPTAEQPSCPEAAADPAARALRRRGTEVHPHR
jgi:uncharacterized membrane protein